MEAGFSFASRSQCSKIDHVHDFGYIDLNRRDLKEPVNQQGFGIVSSLELEDAAGTSLFCR